MTPLPLTEIDPHALPRDRTTLDPAALDHLTRSIAATGLRMPIEVWALATPRPPFRYGLISGFRRLTATQHLGLPTIPAFIRTPASIPEAIALMIAENEVRADLSPWEKARILTTARNEALFPTLDAALSALHPHAPSATRSRLRSIASVVEALDGTLTTPEVYSFRQLARLANALRAGFHDVILAALTPHPDQTAEAQWSRLAHSLDEADLTLRDPKPVARPGYPRRLLHPRPGLTVRRERTPTGWTLHFTGREAHGMMIDTVMDEIERMYGE